MAHHLDTILEHTGRDPAKNFGIVNPPVCRGLKSRRATGRCRISPWLLTFISHRSHATSNRVSAIATWIL
jgi:hypothetical protein